MTRVGTNLLRRKSEAMFFKFFILSIPSKILFKIDINGHEYNTSIMKIIVTSL